MKKLTKSVLAIVLTASFTVSYAQKSKVDTAKTKDIEGVVVTALGIKREKKSLGYATQEIKGDVLRDGANTGNISTQLAGKAAGLQITSNTNFGGSTNVVIRGIKSIAGNNQALFVIDGVPIDNRTNLSSYGPNYDYGNVISDINQEDIESINVLKGAAASALYGERAAAGVIVITTRKGKSKQDNRWGITLSTEYQTGIVDKKTFPEYQSMYGAGYDEAFSKFDVNGDGIKDLLPPFASDSSFGPAFDPNIMVYQWDAFTPGTRNYGKASPWVAAKNGPIKFFETAQTTINSIGIEKGNDKANFLLNYTNYTSDGILPNSNLKKNTISSKIGYKVTDKLETTVYSSLTFQNAIGRNNTGYSDNIVTGFRQWWQTNVDLYDQRDAYNYAHTNATWNRTSRTNGAPKYWNNPYFDRYENYQTDERTRFFGYGMLNYKISNSLSVTARVSTDFYNQLNQIRKAVGSRPESFGLSSKTVSSGYNREDIFSSEMNYDLFGTYNTKFGNDISFNALLGGNIRRNLYSSIEASTEGGLILPGLYSLRNSNGTPLAPVEYIGKSVLAGAYTQLSLGFFDTYFLEGSLRGDKSSNLPKGQNVYWYPSVSGSIILSKLINQDWLSFAKIRANYAQVGKTTSNYRLYDTYNIGGLFNNTPIITTSTIKKEPNLRPEISREIEAGLEAKFFNNRLGFDIALYKTNSIDQIINVDVSSASGYRTQWINAGEVENKGVEVQLNIVPIKTQDFSWNMDFNWSANRNKVLSLTSGLDNILLYDAGWGTTFNAKVGEEYGVIKGSDYVYLNGERVVEDGIYQREPDKVIGKIMPDWVAGVRNSFNYKNLNFSFLIDGQKGGNIFSHDMYFGLDTGLYKETGVADRYNIILPGVNPDGTPNTTPIPVSDSGTLTGGEVNLPDKPFVYDASFIKLREVSINYSLPKSLFKGTVIDDIKVGLVGRNLWILYKKLPYADPESGLNAGLLSRGYSIGSLPTTKNIGINLTVKF